MPSVCAEKIWKNKRQQEEKPNKRFVKWLASDRNEKINSGLLCLFTNIKHSNLLGVHFALQMANKFLA